MVTTKHKVTSPTFLTAFSTILALCTAAACGVAQEKGPEISGQFAGLSYIETVTEGADSQAELPMIVALHFMSGSAETSIEDYGGIDVPARLLSLQGPHPFQDGYSWFPDGYYELDAESQLQVTTGIADRVARFISAAVQEFPTQGKPIVVGYPQGADLAHMIALRRAELISAILPMGGRFPDTWLDAASENGELPAKIVMFHGAIDTAVDVSESLAAARYYTGNGSSVVLYTYAGEGHSYPPEMKADFASTVEQLLR